MFCPQCGKPIDVPEAKFCRFCGSPLEGQTTAATTEATVEIVKVPWEEMSRLGFWRGLLDTLAGVLLTPSRFFGSVEPRKNVRNAIYFGVLVGSFGYILDVLWKILLNSDSFELGRYPQLAFFSQSAQITSIFFSPLLVFLGILIEGVVFHFFLLMAGGNRKGLPATLQVVGYSNAAHIFAVVPYLGTVISAIWMLIAIIIGLREVHGISTTRAVIAVFLPLFALLFAIAAIIALVLLLIPNLFQEFGQQFLPFLNNSI